VVEWVPLIGVSAVSLVQLVGSVLNHVQLRLTTEGVLRSLRSMSLIRRTEGIEVQISDGRASRVTIRAGRLRPPADGT
jgi:hypothetical protein